jgi:hypothetical protein
MVLIEFNFEFQIRKIPVFTLQITHYYSCKVSLQVFNLLVTLHTNNIHLNVNNSEAFT